MTKALRKSGYCALAIEFQDQKTGNYLPHMDLGNPIILKEILRYHRTPAPSPRLCKGHYNWDVCLAKWVFLLSSLLMENHEDCKLTTGLAALHFVVPAATVWDSDHHEWGMQQACKDRAAQPGCFSVSSMVAVPSVLMPRCIFHGCGSQCSYDVIDAQKT